MSAPMKPIDVVVTTLSSGNAEIQWLIPAIVYTPENYSVVYGTDQTQLRYSSEVIIGTNIITYTNQVHSATLSGLESNTTYYYQVVARNSAGINSSDVEDLVSPLPSKQYVSISTIEGFGETMHCSVLWRERKLYIEIPFM